VPLGMVPVQTPYPPLWTGIGTPDGAARAGAQGINALSNSPRAFAAELMARYRDNYTGDEAAMPKLAICRHTYIAETHEEAERVMREAYPAWYDHFVYLWRQHSDSPAVAQYTDDFDETAGKELLLFGTPEAVRAEIEHYIETTGTNYFVVRFAWGSLSYEQSRAALDLFIEEVMPHFQ